MAKIVNLVSFLGLVLLWPKALAIDPGNVKEMADQFSSLTSSTYDIVAKLKIWAPLLRQQPKSHLNRNQKSKNPLKHCMIDQEFEEKIKIPLMNIERLYIEITNPLRDRSQYQKKFIADCERPITSPSGVLIQLQESLMTNCNLKSNEETERYVAVIELFQKIEQQHLQNLTMPMEEYEFIKSSLLAKASWPDMQNELKKILRTGNCTVVGEALRKLHSNLQKTGKSSNRCWLKTIAEGNSWLRDPLLHFAEIIRLELMRAVLIAAHSQDWQ
uniref:Uncharacterized protein n=1 Tax=Globodera pallida TaxID=36090 RepID=A0A183CJY7_GLOPA